jgi:SAM-dependent methyltransferase
MLPDTELELNALPEVENILAHGEPTRTQGWNFACRICQGDTFCVIDLGNHPFANALLAAPTAQITRYPLALHVCRECGTAQLSYCADDHELYSDYIYITPRSVSLSEHYGQIVEFLAREGYLSSQAHVAEIGSNIGRFLEYLAPHVASVLGIDPAVNIAEMANAAGIRTVNEFFNAETGRMICEQEGRKDLIVARHCFAHNEKPWLMLEGVVELLQPDGVLVIENAYFLDTVNRGEFDQIYHEHMYYHSLRSISAIVARYGLRLVDVYHSTIHGGTMAYVIKFANRDAAMSDRVYHYLGLEKEMHQPAFYEDFKVRIETNREELRDLLQQLLANGKTIHAYGASAKSTTLLNYYNITAAMVPYVVDSTVTKHGKYIPLANLQVIPEEEGALNPPDYYLLTVWNYKDEIIRKVRLLGNEHSQFILPHPHIEIVE